MRAIFYYFSGTGNTERAAKALAQEWVALGHEAELHSVRKGETVPLPNGYDRIVVGYPVHAFNAPAPLLRFLKKLPKAGKNEKTPPVFLLRTSGEPLKLNDAAGITPRRILKRKGYAVCGEFHYVMPYNIIFRHSDGMAARMDLGVRLRIAADAHALEAGEGERFRVNALRRATAFVLRVEHSAMPVIGKTFRIKKQKCVGCGVCAKACPQGNIRMKNGKPKFGGSCAGCMGCAFRCPADAVRTSVLNGWRVNGAYSFEGAPATDDEVCNYCHKSYLRYFHSGEDK